MFPNKFIILFFILFINSAVAEPRDPVSHMSTTVGSQARYEFIQSSLAARWTFRLDRVCGFISQVVSTKSENMTFESMFVMGLPSKCTPDGKIRYQLFTSGIAARHTFLLNTETGKAWQVQNLKDKDNNDFVAWIPFED